MCNFFCVYCQNASKRSDCIRFLSDGCKRYRGMKFVIMGSAGSPSLASMPEVFKSNGFGLHPNCFAICMYENDLAVFEPLRYFPPEETWYQHVYSQDGECEEWIDRNMGVRAQIASGVRRAPERPLYYRPPDADSRMWQNILDELETLKERYAPELAARKAYIGAHAADIRAARRDLEVIESRVHAELSINLLHVAPEVQTDEYIMRVKRLIENKYLRRIVYAHRVLDAIPKKPVAYVNRKKYLKHELASLTERAGKRPRY